MKSLSGHFKNGPTNVIISICCGKDGMQQLDAKGL